MLALFTAVALAAPCADDFALCTNNAVSALAAASPDYEAIAADLSAACDGEYWKACIEWGLVEEERGGSAPVHAALVAYARGCTAGKDSISCRFAMDQVWHPRDPLWMIDVVTLSPADAVLGKAVFDAACAIGDDKGCHRAGIWARFGVGGPKDPTLAVSFFEKSCNTSYQPACASLAFMLHSGEGIAKDEARAEQLFAGACAVGDAAACANAQGAGFFELVASVVGANP